MSAVDRNPDFIACRGTHDRIVDFDDGTLVERDPEFRTPCVRLQTEALTRLDRHQTDGDLLIVCKLREPSPWTIDVPGLRLRLRDRFCTVVGHLEMAEDWWKKVANGDK